MYLKSDVFYEVFKDRLEFSNQNVIVSIKFLTIFCGFVFFFL